MKIAIAASMITQGTARIAFGLQDRLYVANLSAQCRLAHAQNDTDDYAVTTGITTTLREFVRMCFLEIGIEIEFSGKGEVEKGVVIDIDEDKMMELGLKPDTLRFGQTVVRVDPSNFVATDIDLLIVGSAQHALPETDLEILVKNMMTIALNTLKHDQL